MEEPPTPRQYICASFPVFVQKVNRIKEAQQYSSVKTVYPFTSTPSAENQVAMHRMARARHPARQHMKRWRKVSGTGLDP